MVPCSMGLGSLSVPGQNRILVSDRDTGLYILDATAVSAQPALLNIKVSPVSVTGPLPATGQVFIVGQGSSPGGSNISLSSNNPAASVPTVVTIPAVRQPPFLSIQLQSPLQLPRRLRRLMGSGTKPLGLQSCHRHPIS